MRLPHRVLAMAVLGLFLLTTSSAWTPLPVDAQYPLFTIYIGVGDGNPARIAFSGMIRDSLRQVGIDAQVAIGTWDSWLDRFLFPNASMLGAIYIDGGWDSVIVGWNWNSPWINPSILYSNGSIPYVNFCLINDSQVELLLENIRQELDPLARFQYQKSLQARTHELSALLILHYLNRTWVFDPDLEGFAEQTYAFPQYGDPMFRNPTESAVKIASYIYPPGFNPLLRHSGDNILGIYSVYESLFGFANNSALFHSRFTPRLAATSWVVENNGLNWTVQLRDDVYWPDGFQFNASDVMLSYQAIVTPVLESPYYERFLDAGLDNESFHILTPHTIRVTFNETHGPYGWAAELLGTVPIVSFAQLGRRSWDGWLTHGSNTGNLWTGVDVNGDPFPVYGPYGLGPYVCRTASSGWDEGTTTFTAHRRMGIHDLGLVNGTVVLYHEGENGSYGLPLNEQWVVSRPEGWSQTIPDLQAGRIDLIDSKETPWNLLDTVDPAWGGVISEPELGFQSLGLNMKHPVFGTGVQTPNGIVDPFNAALYAKYIRQAINYLIPRQTIVWTVLDGFAVPGHEYLPPVHPAYNSEISPYRYNVTKAKELLRLAGYVFPEPFAEIPPEFYFMLFVAGVIVLLVTVLVYLQVRRHRPGIFTTSDR